MLIIPLIRETMSANTESRSTTMRRVLIALDTSEIHSLDKLLARPSTEWPSAVDNVEESYDVFEEEDIFSGLLELVEELDGAHVLAADRLHVLGELLELDTASVVRLHLAIELVDDIFDFFRRRHVVGQRRMLQVLH